MDYKSFFGFRESPFHLTPDPAYFFPSNSHREALQTLLYSIRAGEGFVQITGDPGTGKTLLIRTILQELGEDVSTALIFNPRLSPHELLRTILEDLGLDPAMMEDLSREALLRRFRDFLLDKAKRGRRVIVIIDEAQNLPVETLEELRLLSNLETEKEKLLQIILVGQRELEERLNLPEIRQLHQRITIRYRLEHLGSEDIQAYIRHRLRVAAAEGREGSVTFAAKAITAIYRVSKGTPRLINIISERSLMAAYVEGRREVTVDDVRKAIQSVRGNEGRNEGRNERWSPAAKAVSAALMVMIVLAVGLFGSWFLRPDLYDAGYSFIRDRQAVIMSALGPKEREREVPVAAEGPVAPPGVQEVTSVDPAAVVALAEETDAVAVPDPADRDPKAVFSLSPGASFVRVCVDSNRIQVWKGGRDGPVLVESLDHAWPHAPGFFLAGRDPAMGPYLFNHAAFLRGEPTAVPSPFFERVEGLVPGNAVPVIVEAAGRAPSPHSLQRTAAVQPLFERFIETWRGMNTDQHLALYGRVISIHSLDREKPLVWSRDQFHQRKNDVFRRSGFIDVGVADPVFLLDPADDTTVMIVYHQRYRSGIWQDDGTKVLYLNLQDTPQGKTWRIVAELWVEDGALP